MRNVTLASGLSIFLLSAAACDDGKSSSKSSEAEDAGSSNGGDAAVLDDAGTPPGMMQPDNNDADAATSGPDDVEPDASVPGSGVPEEPTSNVVGAEITTEPFSVTAEALQLISSNVTLRPSGDQYFMQWYGVIMNRGTIPLCAVQAEVDFFVGNAVALEAYGFAKSEPHKTSSNSTVSSACIQPNDFGFVYDNGFEAANLDVQSITKIHVKLEGSDFGGYLHPSAPIFDTIERAPGFGPTSYKVTGSLRAVAPIHNIGLDVFLMDKNWLVFDRLIDTNLDALSSGQSWEFDTTTTDVQEFDTVHPFVSFIEGFPSSAPQLKSADPERLHAERVNANRARFEQSQE